MRVREDELAFRILTHNIRYATESPFPGERPWCDRLPLLLAEMLYQTRYAPGTFLCLQEVLHLQLQDLLNGLRQVDDDWTAIGVGRDDGHEQGEYAPILYRSSIWKLKSSKTFWLSSTPDRPSKGWDAASVRLVTLAVFRHRSTGCELVAMNTHLDDQGSRSRAESARMILREANDWTSGTSIQDRPLPVFVAGDMNSTMDQEAYRVFTETDLLYMPDVHTMCDRLCRYGHSNTFTGFDGRGDGEGLKRIDFVFCRRTEEWLWEAAGHAILDNHFDDDVYSSDHRAVVADVVLRHGG